MIHMLCACQKWSGMKDARSWKYDILEEPDIDMKQ